MTGQWEPVFKEWACLLPAILCQWWMELRFYTFLLFEMAEVWPQREVHSFLTHAEQVLAILEDSQVSKLTRSLDKLRVTT